MALTVTWEEAPDTDPVRYWLCARNDGDTDITDITLNIPEAARGGFYFPGPMAPGAHRRFWLPLPGTPLWDPANMTAVYYVDGEPVEQPPPPLEDPPVEPEPPAEP